MKDWIDGLAVGFIFGGMSAIIVVLLLSSCYHIGGFTFCVLK